MILAREMTDSQRDSAGNATRSGDRKWDSGLARLRMVSRASPGGVSYGWGLTELLVTGIV